MYKIKNEEQGIKRLKARFCSHGNRDREKGNIRNDSANAQFNLIKLILSIASVLELSLGCIGIKSAYLQSGPIKRELYVKPPREVDASRGVLWKLKKLPYGIAEAGRQWNLVLEDWLITEA